MKHRNLKDEKWTRMAIDSLFERGVRRDWEEFVSVMRSDRKLAEDTLITCRYHSNKESAELAKVLIRHFHGDDMGLE